METEKLPLSQVISIMLVQEFPELEDRKNIVEIVCKNIINESMKQHFGGFSFHTVQLCLYAMISTMNLAIHTKNGNLEEAEKLKEHSSWLMSQAIENLQMDEDMRFSADSSH